MKKTFTFLFLWLCWGFALGTLILLGPLRWTITYARSNAWSETNENWIAYVYIALLCIISFLLAFFSNRYFSKEFVTRWKKVTLIGIPLAGAIVALYAFLHPGMINTGTDSRQTLSKQFAVGPYPELAKMYELKNEGYTSVISLLHPAVVPFEPTLISQEKENAAAVGLEFISIPFLPWISDNKQAIDSLRNLIRTGNGKYYIHCYLGRDRTSAAARIVKQENQVVLDYGGKKKDDHLIVRTLERGPVIEIEKDVFLAPPPTNEEYLDIVDDFEQVVILADMSDPADAQQFKTEQEWLEPFNIPISAFNVNMNTTREEFIAFVKKLRTLPKPVFLHGYLDNANELAKFKEIYEAQIKGN